MKEIPLTQGKIALVDDGDYEQIMAAGPWHSNRAGSKWYARKGTYKQSLRKHIYMHQILLPVTLVDHIDGDGLNNQRSNLRPANKSLNGLNSRGRVGLTSRFKGVAYDRFRDKWRAAFAFQGKRVFIARFNTEIEAAKAYNAVALKYAGEFAYLNEVP